MDAFENRITTAPLPFDAQRGTEVVEALGPAVSDRPVRDLILGTAGSSPYLARLIAKQADWLAEAMSAAPESTFDALCQQVEDEAGNAASQPELGGLLRRAKSRAALLIALADLGGVWDLTIVTDALTRIADTCTEAAARWLMIRAAKAGQLPGLTPEDAERNLGLVILAMGKMGARELNYSSDIDLIVLFDDARFSDADLSEIRTRFVKITRELVKILSENTSDGYVFRTDLRLRPAPSTTPVCMAISAAERYYETVGRTWERAAHIKARPLGDKEAGVRYLDGLAPFIWRRNLDYAAIEDTQDMLRKIRAQKAQFNVDAMPGHDLKLGPGGIREIEFFAQTRQLIMGGRDPALRLPDTVGALAALAGAGWIKRETEESLAADYRALRAIEHRLQMIDDAQTHSVPKSPEGRGRLAALCGYRDTEEFETALAERLARVHTTCEAFFSTGSTPKREAKDGDDAQALQEAGFERPADASRTLARWRQGGIPATRSERAQGLFARLEPQIITRLGRAAAPDEALGHFDRFLSGLPAGVQVFSLFTANPHLLDLIVEICAAAPKLAAYLGRHSQVLDALVEQDFWQPLPPLHVLNADLAARQNRVEDYEQVLDETRRWAREQWFRSGVQVLRGLADHREAGEAFTRIAESCVTELLPHVTRDFASRHGTPPGGGMAVIAMGKLGSGEMTAGSDLDLITVYDATDETSDGPRPLPARSYYPRLTQALIASLTAPTAEGSLYEVDMRLRPSGRSGPVAVSLAAFNRYQREEAWVWEHMALSRGRVIAGPEHVRNGVATAIRSALDARQGQEMIWTEAGEMRARLVEAHGAERSNRWSLKHAAGGLMEIEFLAQALGLFHGAPAGTPTEKVLEFLAANGALPPADTDTLRNALAFQLTLQQIERIAVEGSLAPTARGAELDSVCARVLGLSNPDQIEAKLGEWQDLAAGIFAKHLPPATAT